MDQLYDTEPGQPRVPLRATADGYLLVQIAGGGGGGGGSSVTNLSTTVSPTNVVVVSDTGTDATIPLADATNAGAMPPAAVQQLAGLGTASTAAAGDFASAGHTHSMLMTTGERTKLGALPVAADLTTLLAGKMANTLPAMSTVFNAGTAPEKAAFQSAVSGEGWKVLPSAATVSDWSAALVEIASSGFVVAPKNHTINFAGLTIPAGVVVFDAKDDCIIFSNTGLRTSATNNHLLIQSSVPGATRVHIEPQDFFPTGTASKLDMMLGNYDLSPTSYAIMSLYSENWSSGSTRTDKQPYCAMGNVKGVGDWWGIMPQMGFGFGDHDSASGVFASGYYFDTSDTTWRGPMVGPWRAGLVVAGVVYAQAGGKLYVSTGAGTCGATKPTHAAGTVSDGGVSWTFVRDFVANSAAYRSVLLIGGRDDKPLFGLSTYGCQIATDVAMWNAKKLRFMQNTTALGWSMYQAAGTTDFYVESADGASKMRFGGTTSKFMSFNSLAFLSSAKTVTDNGVSPDVTSCRTLICANSAATTITSFTGGLALQEIIVRSSNGNTTIANTANIRLKGGANILLAANDALHFQASTSGTVWTQL